MVSAEPGRMRRLALIVAVLALWPGVARAAGGSPTVTVRAEPVVAGTAVVSRSAPSRFDMVGFRWLGAGSVLFRTRSEAGRWSGWQPAAAEQDAGDPRSGEAAGGSTGGSPFWVGASDRIEYRLRGDVRRLRATYVWSAPLMVPPGTISLGGSPPIVPRQAWGAVESMRRATPLYAPTIRIVIVHHTAGSNDYGPADSAAIVRGIYAYHVRANGWNDIGYNFLVDRYGQVFEGRYGGIDRNVVGAHAAGFNRGSVGIAVIGSYGSSSITPATREALARLISWRLDVAHVDPVGRTTFASGGNERFRAGKTLSLNVVSGHRDTGSTLCPGSRLYAQLPAIARKAASIGLPKLYAPVVSGKLGGEIRFSALLSGSLPWTVSISLGDTAVATGSGEGAKVDWAWDSRKVDASVAYRWTISAPGVRPASGLLPATAKPQPAPPPPPPPLQLLGGLSATPAVVTPNGDGVDDVLAVAYTLAEPATVTVFLVASDGTSTELAREDQQAGPQALQLDLSAVADGSYELRVVAQSATGEQAEASTPIGVDRVITSFSTDSPAFSPNGDRQRDAVVVDFGLAATARAELSVLRDGQSLGTLLAGNLSQGPQSFRWNGAVAGSRLEDGTYQLRLAVEGPTPAERTLEVRIDTTAPELAVTSWSPLELRLSEPAHVVAFVNGRRHELDVGAPSFVLPAQARVRTLSVTASDAAGNRISRRFR